MIRSTDLLNGRPQRHARASVPRVIRGIPGKFLQSCLRSALASGIALALINDCIAAGAAPLPETPRPGDVRPDLPAFERPEEGPEFILPPFPAPVAPESRLSAMPRVFVQKIRLTGNTVFPAEELGAITAEYENREITTEELQALRLALTKYYVERGYINSGAVIPDQQVENGVVEIAIVEGVLTDISVDGVKRLRPAYLRKRLEFGASTPLNIRELQNQLHILLQDPHIKAIHAELQPGASPGEGTLKATIEERLPYQLQLSFDNQLAPAIGSEHATITAAHKNLTGWGDTLSGKIERSKGLEQYAFNYSIPVNARDTTFGLWADRSDSETIEAPFNIIDIESEYRAWGISSRHPFHRTPRDSLWAGVSLEKRRSQTFLLGVPFPFAPGVEADGESEVTVLRISQDWLSRTQQRVIAARSSFNVGVDAFGPTINSTGPDGRFFTWLGQFQIARRFKVGQLIFRTDVQVAADPLLPLEKFAVGGAASVRGYRENQLVRDQGFVSSLEYRFPLFAEVIGANKVQLAPFVDVGGSWDVDAKTPSPKIIASAGIGLRLDPDRMIHAHLYWGKAFVDTDDPGGNLQDHGLHFLVEGQYSD
ncbi:MAG: ShlB/FhaC/HecB family hemolysin secretion/activation protein [Gammaproteobacteria bacterium]|nr:ShlB/FhaC/HecB family hemolysin secretion/activation protein [Gammaproteobacteria bacterium]